MRRAGKEEVHLQRGGGLNGGTGTGRKGGLKKEMRGITHETGAIAGRERGEGGAQNAVKSLIRPLSVAATYSLRVLGGGFSLPVLYAGRISRADGECYYL